MLTPAAWKVRVVALLACALAAAGCGPKPAPVARPVRVAVQPAAPAKKVEAPVAPPAAVVVAAPAIPVAAPPAPEPTYSTERILLLAPRSPLIVEFQLSIDGRPHTQALDRLVEEVLKLADTDGDGRPTWKEVAESKRFKYGQFGNVAIEGENQYKQVIERYDLDRDATVDASELPRFLTRNAGSARAFSVRGTADFRHASGQDSPLWKLLDADEDGTISAEERATAPGRMLSRDTDDDEILLPGDVNPRVGVQPGRMAERRRAGATIVRLLGPHADWDGVRAALEREYGGDHYLRPDAFPLTPELFAQLDKNNDGKLLKTEFPALNEVPPHVVVAIRLGRTVIEKMEGEPPAETEEKDEVPPQDKAPAEPPLRLIQVAKELGGDVGVTAVGGRLTFRVGQTPITFYVNDTVAGGDFEAQAQQALTALDADKNGYLEEKEVPANAAPQLGQFAAVDADEDGKVYPAEIVTYLKQQQAGLRAQVHVRASDREDALFSALDLDHDERLDAREIDAVPDRLLTLDANGDGQLSGDELPESLVVGVARGNLENMEALFVPPPVVARAVAENTPRWFTAMDANGDGAIGPREFLGSAETFGSLDTSGDGLVDVVEATAAKTGP